MKTTRIWTILVSAFGLLLCPATLNAQDRIYEGDSEVEVIDTGDGYITFDEDGLERMRLSNGRLGIGTTTPAERIHVYGGNLMVENHDTTVSFRGNCYSNIDRSAAVYFCRSRGTKVSPLAVGANDALGFFGFFGYDGTAYTGSRAFFQARAGGDWTPMSNPTTMLFATCEAGSTTAQARLFVDDTGYIGIGTVSPTSLLDVYGGAIRARRDGDQYIEIKSVDATGGHITGHSREGNKKPLYIASLHDGSGSPAGETRIQFRVGNESAPTEAMRIAENGNVGIGTTSPAYKLDVTGNLRVSDHIQLGEDGSAGHLVLAANDTTGEGGQAIWHGAGSYDNWVQDVYNNHMRFFSDSANNDTVELFNAGTGETGLYVEGRVGIGTTSPDYKLHVVGKCVSGESCVASADLATVNGGWNNTASGYCATVSGGSANTGSGGMATVIGGWNNTASGYGATVSGGAHNTAGGDFSFAAGFRAKANHDGTFVWGDYTTADFAPTGMNQFLIRATGGVGIGTNDPGGFQLAVNGSAAKPGGGSWSVFSDGRLKTLGGNYERGLSDVTKLNPVRYSYKEGNALELPTGEEHVGLVAQDVQTAIPEAVEENRDGYLMVNNDPIIWAMVNAIKELKAENDSLRQRLEAIEKMLGREQFASAMGVQ